MTMGTIRSVNERLAAGAGLAMEVWHRHRSRNARAIVISQSFAQVPGRHLSSRARIKPFLRTLFAFRCTGNLTLAACSQANLDPGGKCGEDVVGEGSKGVVTPNKMKGYVC